MPSNAATNKRGVRTGLGRGGSSRQVTSSGLKGEGTTTTQLGRAHGGNGRDERSAANFADAGAQVIKAPSAKKHQYD